jgi:ABC-type Fe3+-hydroxamate transport system substrate-binding protein
MAVYTDQLNRTIELRFSPQRIISLVPSQTELLFDLGLSEQVIGITKFCVHPQQWFQTKTKIGGTKMLNIKKIKALQPDLIIANKEENVREQVEELAMDLPVWVSDVATLEGALQMIENIGVLTAMAKESKALVEEIHTAFTFLQTNKQKIKTAYLIWKDPYMTVGGDTFISDLLNKAGFENVFASRQRYPGVTLKELQGANCQTVLLSSEPYPFKQKHIDDIQQHLPGTKIFLVNGEMFSWYGSRLRYAPAYFKNLLAEIASIV